VMWRECAPAAVREKGLDYQRSVLFLSLLIVEDSLLVSY